MAEPGVSVRMRHLCCEVCRELLRDPVTSPCGHSFCMHCLQGCWDQDEVNRRVCSCPHCGLGFPSRPQLLRNTTLSEEARDTQKCEGKKKKQRPTEGPPQALKRTRSCAETAEERAWCWRHNRPLDVYCCTDEQIICEHCASGEHTGHRIGLVSEERRRKQEKLENLQTKFKQILQKQEKEEENMGKMLDQIQEEARQTENYCEGIIVSAINALQRHYRSVKELIGAQEQAAAAQVHIFLQTQEVKMEEMKKRDAELDSLVHTKSNVLFLQKWPSVQLLCEKDHLHSFSEVSEDPLLPFKFTKTAVEQLGKQLEEFCDKEFASIVETADRGEQQESAEETDEDDVQPRCEATLSRSHGLSRVNRTLTDLKMEPKTREQFLQYARELSLDPTTAHEDLAISEGDKKVKLCPQKYKSPAVRYPHKFIHRRQVLCREGLQAERCYYEVEVKGDKAEIALAYKGIDRKSKTRRSAFGGSENSWSLDRSSDHYSVSHNSDSVQLTTPPTQARIGVYLQFKKGTLSFYEVSDSMNFLYRIEAEFTEPLYPGFWLGEKCCISICDLRQSGL